MRLFDFLNYQAVINSDTQFLVSAQRELTYTAANDESVRFAALLLNQGVKKGDRVAILSKNSVEYLLYYYACARIGAVCVPLNFRLVANEWKYILNDSESVLLLSSAEFAPAIVGVAGELTSTKKMMLLDGSVTDLGDTAGLAVNHYSDIDNISLDDATAAVTPVSEDIVDADTIYQMYTSGTTGSPKGVLISHANVSATVHQLALNTPQILTGGDWIVILPVFHAAAALHCFSGVQSAATLHIKDEFAPVDFVETLQNQNINIALAVPAIIKAVLAFVPNLGDYDFSKLELFIYGASPIDQATLGAAMKVFGCDFCQGYGMTESTLAISMLRPADHVAAVEGKPELLQSAGRPVLGTQLTIRDTDDKAVAAGTVGEICIRGPQVMTAYWKLPEATEKALANGWLHTGDAGYLDENGYLFIVDRIKDMIISGGENIYPTEVETALRQHDSVTDVAVIGIPDEKWGETVLACIVPADAESFDSEALDAYCREQLASYKCPKSYTTIDALPLNATGKVLKKELRKPYWENHSKAIA